VVTTPFHSRLHRDGGDWLAIIEMSVKVLRHVGDGKYIREQLSSIKSLPAHTWTTTKICHPAVFDLLLAHLMVAATCLTYLRPRESEPGQQMAGLFSADTEPKDQKDRFVRFGFCGALATFQCHHRQQQAFDVAWL
jgi:hypothetical protein